MTTTALPINNRPLMTPPSDKWAALPAHALVDGVCIYCHEDPNINWATYREYTDWFYEFEWEGEQYHTPESEDEWTYLHNSCAS